MWRSGKDDNDREGRAYRIMTHPMKNHCRRGHRRSPSNLYSNGGCKKCAIANARAWAERNPERRAEICQAWIENNPEQFKLIQRRSRYGMSPEDFGKLLTKQRGRCAGCGRVFDEQRWSRPHVDHDHKCCPGERSCGKCNRGLLCFSCNVIIGHARDNTMTLINLSDYLSSYASSKRPPIPECS